MNRRQIWRWILYVCYVSHIIFWCVCFCLLVCFQNTITYSSAIWVRKSKRSNWRRLSHRLVKYREYYKYDFDFSMHDLSIWLLILVPRIDTVANKLIGWQPLTSTLLWNQCSCLLRHFNNSSRLNCLFIEQCHKFFNVEYLRNVVWNAIFCSMTCISIDCISLANQTEQGIRH